ncbi:hypothetical protein CGT94_18510 [Vibrio metoecus]|nr:hypothetical protein [Vibrio cholerae]PAR45356.1 hypothetical protein CGT94_18510 [Vibrio metoecus]MCD1196881.1 hypothetical protein [Vibrio cholerae]MCD1200621.1 hypothetical protein [Vibrio cholerae]MCD1209670.1 hypothetical protein [Vibrio cholerae]
MSIFTLFSSILLMSLHVNAQTIFYCETQNNKKVEVQIVGDLLQYRFGEKLYKPEIEVLVARRKTSTFQWLGVGMDEYYDVTIPNRDVFYKVFTSRERKPEGKLEAGISVWSKDKLIAEIYCNNDSLYEVLFDIELPKE